MYDQQRHYPLAIWLFIANLLFSLTLQAAPPLAGTLIQNQASASYKDAGGIEQIATSNVVETLIQQVSAMTLMQDQSRLGAAGNSVYFPHVLTNTGNGDDTFSLTATNNTGDAYDFDSLLIYADTDQNGLPDSTTPIISTGLLSAEDAFYFVVAAAIPSAATDGQNGQLTVQGESVFDSNQQQTNTDTVTVSDKAIIEVTKSLSASSGASPSGAYTVTLSYKNTGAVAATDVTLIDVLPTGMSYFADGANDHAIWSEGGAPLTDANEDAQAGISYCAYDNSCTSLPFNSHQVTAIIASVDAGASGTVSFQVMIDAGLAASTLVNIAKFAYNNGTTDIPSAVTNRVPFEIIAMPNVVANGSDTDDTDGVAEPVTVASAVQGATVSFDNIIWNTGNTTDTFDISIDTAGSTFPSGTVFQLYKSDGFTPLLDSNANSVVDTGPLDAGDFYKVVLKAVLPTHASGDNGGRGFSVTKIATSSLDSSISNLVTDHLGVITVDSVDLTNNAAVGQAGALGAGIGATTAALTTETVAPGEQAIFRLFVNNTSAVARSYQLQFSNSNFAAGTFDTNWSVVFHREGGAGGCSKLGQEISSTAVISAGEAEEVCAVVSVPSDAQADGVSHSVYFKAYSAITGASDVKHDAVIVSELPALSIEPSQVGQVEPGSSITYAHLVSNNGNTPLECINIELTTDQTQAGWSSIVYHDVNNNGELDSNDTELTDQMLNSGESFPLLIKIFAPANTPLGSQDTRTVTVTGKQDDGVANMCIGMPLTAYVQDITTVSQSKVSILKQQAPDSDCDGNADSGYVTSEFQVNPGACVMYRLTATNKGALPVNNVRIDDAAPSFTTFYQAGAVPHVSAGNLAGGVAGQDGSITGGSVGGASITVSAGGTLVLDFGVKLD
ncbi:MAG TPA: DUF11 domain-containing protein [Thiothrix sp.]|nr:DUF11 domain-containing protein [Thiothrix sp.]